MAKKFKLALLTGRYQSLQIGHVNNFITASQLAEEVLIFVGSAQESGTERNPFGIDFRLQAVIDVVNDLGLDNVIVVGLRDMTHEKDINFDWGNWVIEHAELAVGQKPDLIIHGDDGRENDPVHWFDEEDKKGIHFLMMPRTPESVSGTHQRTLLILNDYNGWATDSPVTLHRHFQYMRGHLLTIPFYRDQYKSLTGVESK